MITHAPTGLASIIVPCWNQLEFTRLCLKALVRHTRPPWELILVDNRSTDGTREYFAGVQDVAPVPVTVVANATNRGFPAAINQGLQLARGEYLVMLNNDVVVTDAWLDQLVALTNVSGDLATDAIDAAGRDLTIIDLAAGKAGATPGPSEDLVLDGAETSPRPSEDLVVDAAETTPPDPPFARVGKESRSEHSPTVGAGGTVIGLTGPMSNYAAPPQLVENVPYRDLEEMQVFAQRWRDEHRGQWFTVGKLSGFCLLMRRAVYQKIGGLDERFGIGFFDDDDLAERARRAGFELAVAHDLFVHHFGSRTFAGNGIDAEKLLNENERRFAAKWGETVGRIANPSCPRRTRVALRPWASAGAPPPQGNGSVSLRADPPGTKDEGQRTKKKVSLTVIARDEQENLPKCLESVKGLFDEIIVVDTGSKDRTKEIAQEFGARVFDFVWVDDFAAARNAALARATGDYAFWLDADDVVDPAERPKIEALFGRLHVGGDAAHVVRCACDPSTDGSGGETVVDHIRLFPLREDIRWTYRVHEQILPALRRANIPVQWTDITVRHTGYTDPALRARKLDRDTKILREELEDRPDDPFTLFNLGSIAIERQDWAGALGFLQRSLTLSAPTDSITRKLFALIARAHQMLGDSRAALNTCAEGLRLDPDDAELWFRKAVVHRQRGEPAEAEGCWRRILTLRRPEQFCSVDQGIYGHLTRRNLAVLAAERGDDAEAEQLWAEVLAERPGDREARERLARSTRGKS